ncbi:TIGR04104 family putative zinc finger protein [Pseudalkalibacillus sp. SCS-8]|uniref:TIGR04104 family putative zinc finger protein n=1 Tax=Pseudalkalibacillus nanhaiensis TaxID=3115291 RepID=UPI0032DBEE54
MARNTCESSGEKLPRWSIFKRTLIKKRYPIECPHCGNELYFTAKSLKLSFLLIPIIPILFTLLYLWDVPEKVLGITIFAVTLSLLIFFPFLVKLTDKEESLY